MFLTQPWPPCMWRLRCTPLTEQTSAFTHQCPPRARPGLPGQSRSFWNFINHLSVWQEHSKYFLVSLKKQLHAWIPWHFIQSSVLSDIRMKKHGAGELILKFTTWQTPNGLEENLCSSLDCLVILERAVVLSLTGNEHRVHDDTWRPF